MELFAVTNNSIAAAKTGTAHLAMHTRILMNFSFSQIFAIDERI
jgi:hypothetical protein